MPGYNIPRFFEVECRIVECGEFDFIPHNNWTETMTTDMEEQDMTSVLEEHEDMSRHLEEQHEDSCRNVTDVVKTPLRQNNIYISVSFTIRVI